METNMNLITLSIKGIQFKNWVKINFGSIDALLNQATEKKLDIVSRTKLYTITKSKELSPEQIIEVRKIMYQFGYDDDEVLRNWHNHNKNAMNYDTGTESLLSEIESLKKEIELLKIEKKELYDIIKNLTKK